MTVVEAFRVEFFKDENKREGKKKGNLPPGFTFFPVPRPSQDPKSEMVAIKQIFYAPTVITY